jgi:hypothetical protein
VVLEVKWSGFSKNREIFEIKENRSMRELMKIKTNKGKRSKGVNKWGAEYYKQKGQRKTKTKSRKGSTKE